MSLNNCYNIEDLRKLAKKNLPAPIFHYIDGGSDDEVTKVRKGHRKSLVFFLSKDNGANKRNS